MSDIVSQAHDAFARQAWHDAFEALADADRQRLLDAAGLEKLAHCAYMIGRDDEYLRALDRAHRAYFAAAAVSDAARCAFWAGFHLFMRGETARGGGWLARARREIEDSGLDCAEQGYLLLPTAEQQLNTDDPDGAFETAAAAVACGERFADRDLVAAARHQQGRALIYQGRIDNGLALLDEVMVAATAGELSPLITGLIYCSVIDSCQELYALDRARTWTDALAEWCDAQPQLVAFTGTCLVHRAEIMQLSGAWDSAHEEAARACRPRPVGAAVYQQAELQRLKGRFDAAESRYADASRLGFEPQPGLALLRLAQGEIDAACATLQRLVGEASDALQRSKLLPAYVEALVAANDIENATIACSDLQEIAARYKSVALTAMAAQAQGTVQLAAGDGKAALACLRRAQRAWQKVDAPYHAARVRELVSQACRALGDEDSRKLEMAAARTVYEELGAMPDLARIDASTTASPRTHGLSAREQQVLQLLAAGKTNRAIGETLFISERTVARHVSNILAKLDVPTRTAAGAYAHRHRLL